MKRPHSFTKIRKIKAILTGVIAAFLVIGVYGHFTPSVSAACAAPGTDYGTVTTTITVPAAATYRLWSRIMVPDGSNTSYLLEVDGSNCYNVGGGSISASAWNWIAYQNGATNSFVQQSLSQGAHTLKLIGNKPGVKVDRVVALSDLGCVPSGFGDNCNTPSDTTPPIVTLTAPLEGVTVSGNVSLTASASDNTGVAKVEFYDNSTLISTDTTAPYAVTWNSTAVPNGSHVISARAYDAAGNVSSDSSTVTAKNGDTQAPTSPTNIKATATAYNSVSVSWTASTDNIGVTNYKIVRDTVPVATVGAVTTYADTSLSANTSYAYQVIALDGAGNASAASAKVTVKTPSVADSQAPSKPTGLTATAVNTSQINLQWTASTDNIGVTFYDVYRSTGNADPVRVASSPTTSFGDSNLSANTSYAYYVVAKDASGNASTPSDTATAKTPPHPSSLSSIQGTITNQSSHKAIAHARVVLVINGSHHTYQADRQGRYAIFNLKSGRYNVTFRADGYYSKTISVLLNGTPLTQDMSLKKR